MKTTLSQLMIDDILSSRLCTLASSVTDWVLFKLLNEIIKWMIWYSSGTGKYPFDFTTEVFRMLKNFQSLNEITFCYNDKYFDFEDIKREKKPFF